jgi:RNA polymerase sigma factor (sigma-70 family)
MTPTLLHAVARRADAMTPDAELLARYLRERDGGAFEELVRRHGPLVWSVCRQALPDRADAEDAFQAVFLALVRSAERIRDGRALPAWLHGVAVRVTMRARREFARRRARERAAAASSEADRPVSDAAWESLAAALHEEVQRLPEAERTAFVLCELQGVSQPDAAARLGWPLGSLSGRLCKARQKLLDLLAARGIAPAAVGIGITAGTACAVPEGVFEVVKSFPGAPGAASAAASALARGLVEGVAMRAKWTAAAVVLAAIGLTGGAVWLSKAEAQPGAGGPPPGAGNNAKKPERPGAAPGSPFGQPPSGAAAGLPGAGGLTGAGDAGAGGQPGGRGTSGPNPVGWAFAYPAPRPEWEYKFVDASPNRKEFEKVVAQHGREGWEFCSSERFVSENKAEVVLVFKRSKGGVGSGGVGGGMPGPSGGTGMGAGMPGLSGSAGAMAMGPMAGMFGGKGGSGTGTSAAGGAGAAGGEGVWGNWGGKDGVEVRSFALKHAAAADVAEALSKTQSRKAIKAAVPEPRSNRLLVVADAPAMKDVARLVADLDAKAAKPGAEGATAPGSSGGPKPGAAPDMMGAGGIGPMMSGYSAPGGKKPEGQYNVFALKNADAADMETLLKKLFPEADVAAYARTNSLVVRADQGTLEKIGMLLTRLDTDSGRGK